LTILDKAPADKPEDKPQEKPIALPKVKPHYKPSKKTDQALASILKNLLPKTSAAPESKPQESATKPSDAKPSRRQGHTSSRLSDRDTVRLQDAIRQQLMPCWNPPAGAKDARDLVVTVDVSISKEGMITRAEIVRDARLSDTFYRAAAESARRATRNPRCQPLKLPLEHYEDWKDVTLTFDPKNL
jgi:outer membrane biosynthesis protein TonB